MRGLRLRHAEHGRRRRGCTSVDDGDDAEVRAVGRGTFSTTATADVRGPLGLIDGLSPVPGSAPTVVLVDPPRSTRLWGRWRPIGGEHLPVRDGVRVTRATCSEDLDPAEFAERSSTCSGATTSGCHGRAGGSAGPAPAVVPTFVGRYLARRLSGRRAIACGSGEDVHATGCDRPPRGGRARPGRPAAVARSAGPAIGAGAGAVRVPRRAVDRAPGWSATDRRPGVGPTRFRSPGLSVVDAAPSSTPVPERERGPSPSPSSRRRASPRARERARREPIDAGGNRWLNPPVADLPVVSEAGGGAGGVGGSGAIRQRPRSIPPPLTTVRSSRCGRPRGIGAVDGVRRRRCCPGPSNSPATRSPSSPGLHRTTSRLGSRTATTRCARSRPRSTDRLTDRPTDRPERSTESGSRVGCGRTGGAYCGAMVDFAFQEMFPGQGDTPYRQLTSTSSRSTTTGGSGSAGRSTGADPAGRRGARHRAPVPPRSPGAARQDPRRPRGDRRTTGSSPAPCCRTRGVGRDGAPRARTPAPPSSWARRVNRSTHSPDGAPAARRGGSCRGVFRTYTESNLRYRRSCRSPPTTRSTPAPTSGPDRPDGRRRRRVPLPLVAAKGGGSATRRSCSRRPRRCSTPSR